MFSRPAFVDRFLERFPDLFGLRGQIVFGAGLVSGLFALLFVVSAGQIDQRRQAETARSQAETLASTAAVWIDGDAHAGLGENPAKRLSDQTALLELVLRTGGYDGGVRTLRPTATARTALAAQPKAARADALEMVLRVGEIRGNSKTVAYRPEMAPALFEGKCASVVGPSRVEAYAPVLDSWGATTAIVVVDGPAQGPLWRRALFLVAAALLAGVVTAAAIWLARGYARRLCNGLDALNAGVQELARGQWATPVAHLGGPRELGALSDSLENLRARLEAQARGVTPPPAPEPAPAAGAKAAKPLALGERVEFDLALLVQQLIEPARKVAQSRHLDLQLVFPDGVPSRLEGHPVVLYQALDALLRNAFRATEVGKVTLRVNRMGEGPEGWKLRFEVSDTSPGIAFNGQQELAAKLAHAATQDPAQLRDPLQVASALASALGGDLGFETQPGQGSRFGFTVAFSSTAPLPGTAFTPRPETAFQRRPASARGR